MSSRPANRHFLLAFRSYMLTHSRTATPITRASSSSIHASPRAPPYSLSRRTFHITPSRHDSVSKPESSSSSSQTTKPAHQRESLAPQTHYDLFPQTLPSGPPPSGPFTVPLRPLRTEFYALQASAHPDRFPSSQKARAEGLSARINTAYKTLCDPLLRAQYLLSLRGIDVAEDETAKTEDPELLMEVMETREAIEGAEAEEEVEGLREVNERRVEGCVKGLEEAFAGDDLEGAKELAVRLRYWVNVRESLDAWEKGKPVVLVH